MTNRFRMSRYILVSSTVLLSALLSPALAFDPNAGADTARVSTTLPSPTVIYDPSAKSVGYSSPLASVQMPVPPLYPERVAVPTVDASVTNNTGDSSGFVAPAPLTATGQPPVPTGVIPMPEPPSVTTGLMPPPTAIQQAASEAAVVSDPIPELSNETRRILSRVKGNLDAAPVSKGANTITMSRVTPEIKDILGSKVKEDAYEAVGLSIKVRRPGLDANHELNRAYTSLMGGDTDTAIEVYKNILSTDASNQDALFGLAATYHRLGNLDKARPLYGALLQLNPQHREGLNNFLVLVGDESPQEALPELQRLEARNPVFSPIPAQIALVLDKLGYKDEAREKMLRAIELAPDNLTYKFNLAVMLDSQGQAADATALYQLLIESSLRGQKVPASADAMQRRVNYLTASTNETALIQAAQPSAAVN